MTAILLIAGGLVAVMGSFLLLLAAAELALRAAGARWVAVVVRNLQRNRVRTALTYLAAYVLVLVVTLVWSVLHFLDDLFRERDRDFKAVVTAKYLMPSQMPYGYADRIAGAAASLPEPLRPGPDDVMGWSFYGGTTDPRKQARESLVYLIALEPRTLTTMMDDLDRLPPDQDAELKALAARMETQRNAVILGRERMAALNKRVGDRLTVTGVNYRGIDLEFEVIGTFPPGRYDQNGAMNVHYLLGELDRYERDPHRSGGRPHDRRDSCLNVVWVRLPNREAMTRLAEKVEDPGAFATPPLKVETASSAAGAYLEPYRQLLWALRWVVLPAIAVTMALVIANAIGISVRERRTEIAVLKVLGFRPGQILGQVLGEAVLIGAAGGLLSALTAYLFVQAIGGVQFPVVFFSAFYVPAGAVWRGLVLGAGAAAAGSFLPAWSAARVKVTDVFSRVA